MRHNEDMTGESVADELGIDWEENELMRSEFEEIERKEQLAAERREVSSHA